MGAIPTKVRLYLLFKAAHLANEGLFFMMQTAIHKSINLSVYV